MQKSKKSALEGSGSVSARHCSATNCVSSRISPLNSSKKSRKSSKTSVKKSLSKEKPHTSRLLASRNRSTQSLATAFYLASAVNTPRNSDISSRRDIFPVPQLRPSRTVMSIPSPVDYYAISSQKNTILSQNSLESSKNTGENVHKELIALQ